MSLQSGIHARQGQSQSQALAPGLRQSLEILQMPLPELQALVQRELLANCLLDLDEEEDGLPDPLAPESGPVAGTVDSSEDEWAGGDLPGVGWDEETGQPTGDLASGKPSLHEHLLFQLHLAKVGEPLRQAASYLIGNLDDDGYLRCDPIEAADALRLDRSVVARALDLLQSFEPAGVGARDLRECLLIQAKSLDPMDAGPLVQALIEDYLDDLARGRYTYLASSLGCPVQEIRAAAASIRGLDPRPGRNYGRGGEAPPFPPDLTIRRVDGDYIVLLREACGPRLKISPHYRQLMERQSLDDETKGYLLEKLKEAVRLIRCIEQRRTTLRRIGETIARRQRDFLEKGPSYLRPLTMHEVADEEGLHESTISRAIDGKYAGTPHGVFPLRQFFQTGLAGESGQAVSAARVKELLRAAVSGENTSRPLSDQDLVSILRGRGCAVARRTVAKYRQSLNILPAHLRRR